MHVVRESVAAVVASSRQVTRMIKRAHAAGRNGLTAAVGAWHVKEVEIDAVVCDAAMLLKKG